MKIFTDLYLQVEMNVAFTKVYQNSIGLHLWLQQFLNSQALKTFIALASGHIRSNSTGLIDISWWAQIKKLLTFASFR